MAKAATEEALLALAHSLSALRTELELASTAVELDSIVDRYFAMGVFHRLKPAARQLLSDIISRRMHEVEAAADACSDSAAYDASMARYDQCANMREQVRKRA